MSMFDTFDFGHYASNCLELNQTYNLYFKWALMILMGNRILILLMVMMHIGLLQAMLVKVVFIALMFLSKF